MVKRKTKTNTQRTPRVRVPEFNVYSLPSGNWGVGSAESGRLLARVPSFSSAQRTKERYETRVKKAKEQLEKERKEKSLSRTAKKIADRTERSRTVKTPRGIFGRPSRSARGKSMQLLRETISKPRKTQSNSQDKTKSRRSKNGV